MTSHAPHTHGQSPLRTVQVLGGGSARSSTHVRSLAAGLVARGVRVTVCAPAEVERVYGYADVGARHVPVPRSSDPAAVAALRIACSDADLVHAHGLNAAVRSALALGGRGTPLVVTWHTRAHAEGARVPLLRLLERRVARAAAVVLGTSTDLVDRARRRGARDARLSAVAPVLPRRSGVCARQEDVEPLRLKTRAEIGSVERPLLIAVGALEAGQGLHTLLNAARTWRRMDPVPLLVVAGEGPLRAVLQHRIRDEALPVQLLGHRDDVRELLAAADVAVLPTSRPSHFVLAQEALYARVPLVAADGGSIRELVGDAAELVPENDGDSLAGAVVRLLDDPAQRELLGDLGEAQAATWPTEDENVAQVLSVYDELTEPVAGGPRR